MPDRRTYSIFNPTRCQPYLYEPYLEIGQLRIPGGEIVVMKCVQTGWTELGINSALWFMDTKREPALYMLRTDAQLGPFVLARIDPAITASPYIREGFSTVADSAHLKIGWKQPLYFRGAHSVDSLVEFSAGLIVHDEKNDFDPEGIAASLGRREGMIHKWAIALSNAKVPEDGIHLEWLGGSQGKWALWCEKCQEYVIPQWPESANRNHPLAPMCPSYDHELDKTQGKWIHANPEASYKSYTMDHFASPRTTPIEMIEEWEKIHGDPTKMGAFYNLRLGLPWAPEGTQITDVSGLPSTGQMIPSYDRSSVMGVDVGPVLHVVIRRLRGGILWAGMLAGSHAWDELGRKMHAYNVLHCMIDAQPERTKAKDFAKIFPGMVTVVMYNSNPMATEAKWSETEDGVPMYTGLRTPMIDAALALIHTKTEGVPSNLPTDFWDHFRAVSRQMIKRADGQIYSSYVNSKPDHYVHAFTYAVCAGERYGGSDGERTQFFPGGGRRKEEKKKQEQQEYPDDVMLALARGQGYVGKGCTMPGGLAMKLVYEGKDPCAECMESRDVCGGKLRRG